MKRPCHTFVILCIAALLTSCGSIEEMQQEEVLPPVVQPEPVIKSPEPPPSFETNTDTVVMTNTQPAVPQADSLRQPEIRFMVQIGAFKDPTNASVIQGLARERYRMPVFSDYNSTIAMYQIRIGFFESRETAQAFRQKMSDDFPNDYRDAWVVQLAR